MLSLVATLSDEGLRRNYLNKVTINRLVVPAWLAESTLPEAASLEALTGTLGRAAAASRGSSSACWRSACGSIRAARPRTCPSSSWTSWYEFDRRGAGGAVSVRRFRHGAEYAAELAPVGLPAYMLLHAPTSACGEALLPPEQREALLTEATGKARSAAAPSPQRCAGRSNNSPSCASP